MREVPGLIGDRRRLDEEIVASAFEAFSGPGEVDHGIDHDIGDMNPLRPHLTRDRFGEDTLRRLVGAKPAKLALPRSAEVLPVAISAPPSAVI